MAAKKDIPEFERLFHGDRKRAIARLRRMVERACESLPTARMNSFAFHMAIHLDAEEARRSGTYHSGLSTQRRGPIAFPLRHPLFFGESD
jgi:hypothetical protein